MSKVAIITAYSRHRMICIQMMLRSAYKWCYDLYTNDVTICIQMMLRFVYKWCYDLYTNDVTIQIVTSFVYKS
jgi:HD superfamily phosphohydrolase